MKLSGIVYALAFAVLPLAAQAEKALGIWLTEPDRKSQVAHVGVVQCGAALCGTILRAYDKSGRQIVTPNVGKRIFWDVVPTGAGDYKGRAYVPVLRREYPASMTVQGDRMIVKGCAGPACMSQRWSRLK